MSLTFKQFLVEATKKKKAPPKPKARPKKNLWFNDRNFWLNDLRFTKNNSFALVGTEDEESSDIYATDPNINLCYGVWQASRNQGITFFQPRPIGAVAHPRIAKRLKVLNMSPAHSMSALQPPTQ